MVPIHATILFAGAGSNDDGKAHVTCNVKVLKPDGSIYGAREGTVATKNPVPTATTLLLASERLVVRIEPKDPAGIYVVEAVVKDEIKKIDLKLKQSFLIEK